MMARVKLVVQCKLLPSPEQAAALKATLRACNDASNWVSAVAFGMTSRRNYDVRKHTYRNLRAAGIGSQAGLGMFRSPALRPSLSSLPPISAESLT
jgi:putative transposase